MKLFTQKEIKAEQQISLEDLSRKESMVSTALKAQEAKFQNTEQEYQKKKEQRERELGEIEMKIAIALTSERKEIEVLEERKREALEPITRETQFLVQLSLKNEKILKDIADERGLRELELQQISKKEAELNEKQKDFENSQSSILNLIARRQQDLDASISMSDALLPVFEEAKREAEKALKRVDEATESAKKAEFLAKAAMFAADQRILKEKDEQEKTDEKRKMLGVAIRELKQRGLWHKLEQKKT